MRDVLRRCRRRTGGEGRGSGRRGVERRDGERGSEVRVRRGRGVRMRRGDCCDGSKKGCTIVRRGECNPVGGFTGHFGSKG